jgi:hypothetical protein
VTLAGRTFASSWSDGKDSGLALDRVVRAGGRPAASFTMFTEVGARSRSRGLRRAVHAFDGCAFLDVGIRATR